MVRSTFAAVRIGWRLLDGGTAALFIFVNGLASSGRCEGEGSDCAVPELTGNADVKLNARVSLRAVISALPSMRRALFGRAYSNQGISNFRFILGSDNCAKSSY